MYDDSRPGARAPHEESARHTWRIGGETEKVCPKQQFSGQADFSSTILLPSKVTKSSLRDTPTVMRVET